MLHLCATLSCLTGKRPLLYSSHAAVRNHLLVTHRPDRFENCQVFTKGVNYDNAS